MVARNAITNHGTINVQWTGSENENLIENEANYLDNYGVVNVQFTSPTPTENGYAAANTRQGEFNGWEIYQPSSAVDVADWEHSFYNHEDVEVHIALEMDKSDPSGDSAVGTYNLLMTGLKMTNPGCGTLPAVNEGLLDIDITYADARAQGIWLLDDNRFTNSATGVIDIDIIKTESDPAINYASNYAAGIRLDNSSGFLNDGTIDIYAEGLKA